MKKREKELEEKSEQMESTQLELSLRQADLEDKEAALRNLEAKAIDLEVREADLQVRSHEVEQKENSVAETTRINAAWQLQLAHDAAKLNEKAAAVQKDEDACVELMRDYSTISNEVEYMRKQREVLDQEIGAIFPSMHSRAGW